MLPPRKLRIARPARDGDEAGGSGGDDEPVDESAGDAFRAVGGDAGEDEAGL